MLKKLKSLTQVYLIDDKKAYFNEITERFDNPLKYKINTFTSVSSFFRYLESNPVLQTNLQIVFFSFSPDHNQTSDKPEGIKALHKIKRIIPLSEVFILSFKINQEFENMIITSGASGLIQKNENAVLRMTNKIKRLISEKNLAQNRKTSRMSIKLLLYFVLLVVIVTAIIYFIYPEYFSF